MRSVPISGSPYGHFWRALEIGKLPMVLAPAAELPRLQLDDALGVRTLIAEQSPPERYQAAAARWCGRLATRARRVAGSAAPRRGGRATPASATWAIGRRG